MKIVFNALSARLGGGQTYLINLFEFVPVNEDLEILVFALCRSNYRITQESVESNLPGPQKIRLLEPFGRSGLCLVS